ncbi:MAG: DUF1446 domain-containing protein [Saprospiraceae bacterium]|nr:DUF1446 domain-containing protein [Saprospiraceae bacterium]
MKKRLRLGAGAGYSGDRIEPAVQLAEKGQLDYLIFECLAERTIALAQKRKSHDPNLGFDPLLEDRMRACLVHCVANKTKIITNMGAANPVAAMEKTIEVARELGIEELKFAAITGDDVFSAIEGQDLILLESGQSLRDIQDQVISANAYLGIHPIIEALQWGADVIITGRVADPSLFVAPIVNAFHWDLNDYDKLGKATLLGHLMECAGQITGGYFADPGYKDVSGLAKLGFPIAEIDAEGNFLISKLSDTGGQVTEATCKEQLLYEIHDPANYLTPDVVADFSQVSFITTAKDVVEAVGATGKPKSGKLKVSVGYRDSYIGEGQISYAGPGALQRANLAIEVLKERFRIIGINLLEERYDLVGINSLGRNSITREQEQGEVRLRVAVRSDTMKDAISVGNEVEALYTNGPAGGGGAWKHAREVLAIQSVLIPEEQVKTKNYYRWLK